MKQSLLALEQEIEQTLFWLMELEIEEASAEMSQLFAKLLARVQLHNLINYKLEVLVEPADCLPETRALLESLIDVKKRYAKRRKLLTHRDILKIWLRKNNRYKTDYLPKLF